jgi:hypothetical protein
VGTMGIGQSAYSSLRSLTPGPLRRPVAVALEEFGALTNALRMMPSFIIVGGQRCGTNSLYEYVVGHPSAGRAMPGQEIHYFDVNFDRGPAWYRGHFPTRVRSEITKRKLETPLVTGECSPYYMFHPHAPQRIAEMLPSIKLLVLLRDPVDRAYSHYNHERARGYETLPFENAIDQEPDRLRDEVERMQRDPQYQSFNHQHFSYVSRGEYISQLEVLYSLFPKQNILVLISEDLFANPAAVHARVLEFLGLPRLLLSSYPKHNPGRYSDIGPRVRRRLAARFAEPNHRLYHLLGGDLRWE